jgi:Heterokaryon incompatibility protein (HET)
MRDIYKNADLTYVVLSSRAHPMNNATAGSSAMRQIWSEYLKCEKETESAPFCAAIVDAEGNRIHDVPGSHHSVTLRQHLQHIFQAPEYLIRFHRQARLETPIGFLKDIIDHPWWPRAWVRCCARLRCFSLVTRPFIN